MKRRLRGIVKGILISLFLFILSIFAINLVVCNQTYRCIITDEQAKKITEEGLPADCILVLGCAVRSDKTPSRMLHDRVEKGIFLYREGVSERLLMSGDHQHESYNEVQVMKNMALDAGIADEAVFMDHAGISTYDSIYRASKIFQAKRIIIVTQKYHLPRALYIARKLGMEAYGVAANGNSYTGQSMRTAREVLARVKDFFSCLFLRPAQYMGECIPVSGNGQITND